MKMESVELTGVYPHFKSFDEALKVVEKKQKQYGTEPVKFGLLVFVNHEKSEEWINMLREKVISEHPFLSIWTNIVCIVKSKCTQPLLGAIEKIGRQSNT